MSQLDILFSGPTFYTVPPHAPGRIMGDDFVNFNLPQNFPSHRYKVAVEGLNTSSDVFRTVGNVNSVVRLPHVQFPSCGTGLIALLPDSEQLPRYVGQFARGATYTVPPAGASRWSTIQMTRHGVI